MLAPLDDHNSLYDIAGVGREPDRSDPIIEMRYLILAICGGIELAVVLRYGATQFSKGVVLARKGP